MDAYERVRPVLEAVAPRWMESLRHVPRPGVGRTFRETVHNGIEYAVMELLAESYGLMKRGLGLSDDELHQVFEEWNQGELSSYWWISPVAF